MALSLPSFSGPRTARFLRTAVEAAAKTARTSSSALSKMILRDWPPKVQEDCRTVPVTLRYNGTSAYRSLPLHQRCEANGPTSGHPIIIGAGLGGTATRSVAAAVRRLGFATCHWTGGNHGSGHRAGREQARVL